MTTIAVTGFIDTVIACSPISDMLE